MCRVLPKKTLNVPCSIRDIFVMLFDSRNFSPWGDGVYYRCDCIFKEPWVSDVWISSFPAAQPVSSKLHDGWWAYKDLVQGSFIPGKPFKRKKRKQCESMHNVSCQSHAACHTKTRKICRGFVCWLIAHKTSGCQLIFYSVWFTLLMYVNTVWRRWISHKQYERYLLCNCCIIIGRLNGEFIVLTFH